MSSKQTSSNNKGFFLWRWFKRAFFGGSKELSPENERYDSPGRLAVKRFFRRPAALCAVIGLVAMFLFVFIGPLFAPIDLSYAETLHKNVSPNFSMMAIPKELQSDLKNVSCYGRFSVGVSESGKIAVWGFTDFLAGNLSLDVPEEVQNTPIVDAAAGMDHVVAVGENGKVYAWGQFDNGQYGLNGTMIMNAAPEPDILLNGTIDASQVKQVICGNQVSAILMQDGTLYAWGNYNAGASNLPSMQEAENLSKVVFTTSALLGLTDDGRFVVGSSHAYDSFQRYREDGSREILNTWEHIGARKVADIVTAGTSVALLMEDGELFVVGGDDAALYRIPTLAEGEKIVSISGGTRHYTLVTDQGRAYAWGSGALGQTKVPASLQEEGAVDEVLSAGFQNYAVKDGKMVSSWGLKGYLMGTDDLGRDVFNRVMNGGRMTMTIGAVAVIVSSIIGIIIGCLSGYFGGPVDMFLMRVTEIFGAIPFLPFALVLSSILRTSDLSETVRIFIIMVILGLLSWTGLARLVRGQVLAEREKEFVTAAKSMGIRERRIAFKHILPNIISVILVTMTLDFASCMLTESSLSYLGFGVQLPRPTWGNMLYGCNNSIVIQSYWWRWVFPALFLSIATICINVIGDTLRDVLDPKSEVER